MTLSFTIPFILLFVQKSFVLKETWTTDKETCLQLKEQKKWSTIFLEKAFPDKVK